MTTLAYLNIPIALFDAATLEPSTGTTFAVPARQTTITWQTVFGTAPDTVSVSLQASLDGINFETIDTSTAVGGEIRTIEVNAVFIRAIVNSNTGGSTVTVLANHKDL